MPLQGNGNSQDGGSDAHAVASGTSSHGNARGGGRGGKTTSTDNGLVGDKSLTSTGSLVAGGGRSLSTGSGDIGRDSLGRDGTVASRAISEANLGDDDLSLNGLDCGGSLNGGTASDARLSDGSSNDDSGVVSGGDDGGASDGDVLSDRVGTSGDDGVLLGVRSADTLEEGNGLGNGVVVLSVGVQALEDVVNEVLGGTVAGSVGVVLAVINKVEEGVQAAGYNIGNLVAILGSLRSSRLLLRTSLDGLGSLVSDGLDDRVESGGNSDSLSDNSRLASGDRAVGDLRAARGDGLDLSLVDGGDTVVAGDDGGSLLRDVGGSVGRRALGGLGGLLTSGSSVTGLVTTLDRLVTSGLLASRLGTSGLVTSECLGNGADSGGDGNGLGNNNGSTGSDGAVGNLRSARGDGLDVGGVDGGGAVVDGGLDRSLTSRDGGLLASRDGLGLLTSRDSLGVLTGGEGLGVLTSGDSLGLLANRGRSGLSRRGNVGGLVTSRGSGLLTGGDSLGLLTSRNRLGVVGNRSGSLLTSRDGLGLLTSRDGLGLLTSRDSLGILTSGDGLGLLTGRNGLGVVTVGDRLSVVGYGSGGGLSRRGEVSGLLTGRDGLGLLSRNRLSVVGNGSGGLLTGGDSLSVLASRDGLGVVTVRSRGGLSGGRDFSGLLLSGNSLGVLTAGNGLGLVVVRGERRLGVLGERRLVTVEVDLRNLDSALVLGLVGLLGVDEVDLLGTTTLGVVDVSTILGTVGLVLASRAVRHVVVELETAVKLGLHVELVERELLLLAAGTATERGSLLLLTTTFGKDRLAKVSASEIALRLVGSTGPALEIPVVVLLELADLEVIPLPALLLVLLTLVVDSLRRSVLGGFLPVTPVSGGLAGSESQKGKVGLHGE
jgi:hypothetical protein